MLGEAIPEFFQHRQPFGLAFGDEVELVFQLRGEVVVHVAREMLGEKFIHDAADIGGHEAFFIQHHVFALNQGGHNAGVGGGAADAELLQGLHQTRFGITRRRLGEVLLAEQFIHRDELARFHGRQLGFAVLILLRLIRALQVHGDEAGEGHNLAAGAK